MILPTPHPHIAKRNASGPPTVKAAAATLHKTDGPIVRANRKIGLGITRGVGTMWAAYIFAGISVISLPAVLASGQLLLIVQWLASVFLQLVLLPIIIVGQNVQAAAADARSLATYEDAGAILEVAQTIQEHLAAQDEALSAIVAKFPANTA